MDTKQITRRKKRKDLDLHYHTSKETFQYYAIFFEDPPDPLPPANNIKHNRESPIVLDSLT